MLYSTFFKYICYITLKGGTANDGPTSASAWRQAKYEQPDRKAEYFPNTQQECTINVILNSLNCRSNILTTCYKFFIK
jgi:hypothetical protein